MPRYVVLYNFSADAVAGMMERPTDRRAAVSEALRSVGGELEALYWMLGQYDGMAIGTAPDTRTMTAVMVAVAGSGAFSHVETHELIESSEIADVLARAKEVKFSPPGA